MRNKRISALLLSLSMAVSLAAPALASEPSPWLIPGTKAAPAFSDTTGLWFEDEVKTVVQAGLMQGVSGETFNPSGPLTGAHVVTVCARLHSLLTGGDGGLPSPAEGQEWYDPAYSYLAQAINYTGANGTTPDGLQAQTNALRANVHPTKFPIQRGMFIDLLGKTLAAAEVALPEINHVSAVPDCQDDARLAFYRWGVLGGADTYGMLEDNAPLTRAAAAAVLARLIDPAQRLTLNLTTLDLCDLLLGVSPDTVVMTIGSTDLTAEQVIPTLVSTVSMYNHSHLASLSLASSGKSEADMAVMGLQRMILWETAAQAAGIPLPEVEPFHDGYQFFTAAGLTWTAQHQALPDLLQARLGAAPTEPLPEVRYTAHWAPPDDLNLLVRDLPYWGGVF